MSARAWPFLAPAPKPSSRRARTGSNAAIRCRKSPIAPVSARPLCGASTAPRANTPAAAREPPRRCRVKRGDTLSQVAHGHVISTTALRRVNALASDTLRPGQTLQLPEAAGPVTHRVAAGDSLWGIAHRYDVSVAQLR